MGVRGKGGGLNSSAMCDILFQRGNENVPVPVHKYAGYPKSHPGSLILQEVEAVALDLMMVDRGTFTTMNGFNEGLGERFAAADFCLRTRVQGGRAVLYVPAAVALSSQSEEDPTDNGSFNLDVDSFGSDSEIQAFADMYVFSRAFHTGN